MQDKKILVIGPTFLDIATNIDFENLHNLKNSTVFSPGGKGYNIAHTLRLFDAPTILATIYGKDEIGNYLDKCIKKEHIESPKNNSAEGVSSGVFVAVLDNNGNALFDKADIDILKQQKFPEIQWSDISIVIVLSSTHNKILEKLKQVKKDYPSIKFCLEMSGSKTSKNIAPYLSYFDFFISNYKEAQSIGKILNTKDDVQEIIHKLLENIDLVIITHDKYDIFVGNSKSKNLIKKYDIKNVVKNVISSIGAGDTFTATFCAAYYYYQKPIEQSINIAMKMSSLTVLNKEPFIKKAPKNLYNLLVI